MSESPKNPIDVQRTECGSIAQRIARVLAICAALGGGCAAVQNADAKAPETDEWAAEWVDEPTVLQKVVQRNKKEKNELGCRPLMPASEDWAKGPEIFEKDGRIFAVGKVDRGDSGASEAYFIDKARFNAIANLKKYLSGLPGNYSFPIPGPITQDYAVRKGCPRFLYALVSVTKDTSDPQVVQKYEKNTSVIEDNKKPIEEEKTVTEKRKPYDWDHRPDWLDMEDAVKESGKYIYAVGSEQFDEMGDLGFHEDFAKLDATMKAACYLNGRTKIKKRKGGKEKITVGDAKFVGTERIDSYLEKLDDGTFVIHVLMAVKK